MGRQKEVARRLWKKLCDSKIGYRMLSPLLERLPPGIAAVLGAPGPCLHFLGPPRRSTAASNCDGWSIPCNDTAPRGHAIHFDDQVDILKPCFGLPRDLRRFGDAIRINF